MINKKKNVKKITLSFPGITIFLLPMMATIARKYFNVKVQFSCGLKKKHNYVILQTGFNSSSNFDSEIIKLLGSHQNKVFHAMFTRFLLKW